MDSNSVAGLGPDEDLRFHPIDRNPAVPIIYSFIMLTGRHHHHHHHALGAPVRVCG